MVHFHAEKIDIELLRAGEVLDVENHVVDAGNFEGGRHVHLLFGTVFLSDRNKPLVQSLRI